MVKVINDFITPEEEILLLSHLTPSRVTAGKERNKILRFGSPLPYKGKTELIPTWLSPFCMKVIEEWCQFPGARYVDHVTINEYHKGQFIDYHIDSKSSGEVISVLSIESDAVMGLKEKSGLITNYKLPKRSLIHITKEDRWDKEHKIYPVDAHRWSLVFRKGTEIK